MSPVEISKYKLKKKDYKVAAVLLILYKKKNEWYIAYMKRTSRFKDDKHAGQISFPGGRKEENESILECALRETHEEFGIPPAQFKILGALNELYVFVSNFLVYPFVAFANDPLSFKPEKEEVEAILEIPLEKLLDPQTKKRKDIRVVDRLLEDVPYYDLDGRVLWGATAMITENFLDIIREINKV